MIGHGQSLAELKYGGKYRKGTDLNHDHDTSTNPQESWVAIECIKAVVLCIDKVPPKPDMSVNDLTTILDIINTNVSIIEQTYAKHQTPIPSLNEPFKRLAFDESELIEATNLVVAAASQLIAILRRPMMSLVAAVGGVGIIFNMNANILLTNECSNS